MQRSLSGVRGRLWSVRLY